MEEVRAFEDELKDQLNKVRAFPSPSIFSSQGINSYHSVENDRR